MLSFSGLSLGLLTGPSCPLQMEPGQEEEQLMVWGAEQSAFGGSPEASVWESPAAAVWASDCGIVYRVGS